MTSNHVKKRLMYLSGEDFYLFCYSIFIILDGLDCDGKSSFKDYRKLAFLVNIVSSEKLIYIIENSSEAPLNPTDTEILFNSYSSGLMRRSEVLKILFTLEKRGFIELERGSSQDSINLFLKKNVIPKSFFNREVFSKEYENISILRKSVRRLKTLKLETMLDNIYTKNGVSTWGI